MRWSSRPVVLLPQTVNSNLSSSIATAGTTRWRQASGGSAVARQLRALGRACPSLWLVLLLLLLLPLSCLLRYHLGTQRDRASAWSTYYHREAQGAQQQLE